MSFLDLFKRRGTAGSGDDSALRASLAAQLDSIEAELRRLGWWQAAIEPERMNFTRAFAGDTMAFSQWLQFVFLPNARGVVTGGGALPPGSMVAAQAVREFDGQDEAGPLCTLLARFDQSIVTRTP